MKKSFFTLIMAFAATFSMQAQSAQVQVIHNSADLAAATVDVYANGVILLDDFAFRTATPFVELPAGVDIELDIAPGNSTGPADAVFNTSVAFAAGESYIVVAEGIVSGSGYAPATPFGLSVYDMGRQTASMAMNTDVLVHHGSTDAPTVDVVETGVGAGIIVDDASYGDFAGYLELATMDYELAITDMTGSTTVATYAAPLQTLGLEGAALTVLASGFLDPSVNSDGPAFGLWVALASGGALVELPLVTPPTTARLQVIHNSADAAAAVVDIYAGADLLVDDFEFRTATAFIDVPGDVEIEIGVAPGTSTSAADAIASFPVTFTAGETYIVVADGIVSGSGYTPAPAFGLQVYDMGREMASMMTMTDVLVHHGSTDAPTVDVVETGVGAGTIVDDASYTDFAGYLELGTLDYELSVTDMTGTTTVATYGAPLQTLGLEGAALTVLASGFLDPSVNSDGPAFGLWVALASGGALVELPLITAPSTARLQVIHNSADAAAAVVDIYAGADLLVDDFVFRTATPFIDVPGDVEIAIGVAPGTSMSAADAIATFPVTFTSGETYVVVADGIVSGSGYSPAPAFGLQVYDMGREMASMMTNTDVLVHHGSTDAPTVDVVETGVGAGTIVDDASYTDFAGYLELGTLDYELSITDMTGATTVATYGAPLQTLGLDGAAITVLASGFLDPSVNSDGPGFGLWVALADGGNLLELPIVTSLNDLEEVQVGVFPNPATDQVNLMFDEEFEGNLSVISVDGRTVRTERIASAIFNMDVQDLAPGTYSIVATSADRFAVSTLIIK